MLLSMLKSCSAADDDLGWQDRVALTTWPKDPEPLDLGPSALDAMLSQAVERVVDLSLNLTTRLRSWIAPHDDDEVVDMAIRLREQLGTGPQQFTDLEVAATAVYLAMHKRVRVYSAEEMNTPPSSSSVNLEASTIAITARCSLLQVLLCASAVKHVIRPCTSRTYIFS